MTTTISFSPVIVVSVSCKPWLFKPLGDPIAVVKGRSCSPKLGTPGENRRVVLWYLLFIEDPEVDDCMVFDGGDNLRIAVGFVGIEPDAAFYESLADGEARPWPVQLLANAR